jgi:hypothetical protein
LQNVRPKNNEAIVFSSPKRNEEQNDFALGVLKKEKIFLFLFLQRIFGMHVMRRFLKNADFHRINCSFLTWQDTTELCILISMRIICVEFA